MPGSRKKCPESPWESVGLGDPDQVPGVAGRHKARVQKEAEEEEG